MNKSKAAVQIYLHKNGIFQEVQCQFLYKTFQLKRTKNDDTLNFMP